MVSLIKTSELCLRPGHFSRQCPSLNRCKKCQKPHHTLIHSQNKEDNLSQSDKGSQSTAETSNTAAGIVFNSLLMTYWWHVKSSSRLLMVPLLRLVHCLIRLRPHLRAYNPKAYVCPVCPVPVTIFVSLVSLDSRINLCCRLSLHSMCPPSIPRISVSAVVVPNVTCDLPIQPVQFNSQWTHLDDVKLADPDFGQPGRIDVLLGIWNWCLHWCDAGPPASPAAIFGWVLIDSHASTHVISGDDLLRQIEENPKDSSDERSVISHSFWRRTIHCTFT